MSCTGAPGGSCGVMIKFHTSVSSISKSIKLLTTMHELLYFMARFRKMKSIQFIWNKFLASNMITQIYVYTYRHPSIYTCIYIYTYMLAYIRNSHLQQLIRFYIRRVILFKIKLSWSYAISRKMTPNLDCLLLPTYRLLNVNMETL